MPHLWGLDRNLAEETQDFGSNLKEPPFQFRMAPVTGDHHLSKV